jgi:hypothetical protein
MVRDIATLENEMVAAGVSIPFRGGLSRPPPPQFSTSPMWTLSTYR